MEPTQRDYTSPLNLARLRYGFEWLARIEAEISFELFLVPPPFLARADYPEAYELIDQIVNHEARRAGLNMLSLSYGNNNLQLASLEFAEHDYLHLNEEGHEQVATSIIRSLAQRGVLPQG